MRSLLKHRYKKNFLFRKRKNINLKKKSFCYFNNLFFKKNSFYFRHFFSKSNKFFFKKTKSSRFRFWFPLFYYTSFSYFLLSQKFLLSNTKNKNLYSLRAGIIRQIKQYNFLVREFYGQYNNVADWIYSYFFPYSNYFKFFQIKKPFYRRVRKFKSRKFLKFTRFFTFRRYKVSWFKFFFQQFIENLCFKTFKLRHFFYKKIILKRFFKKIFQVNSFSFLKKKSVFKTISFLDSRLDFSLVRLNFYSSIYKARKAVFEGLVFLNFKRVFSFKNCRLVEGDLLFVAQHKTLDDFVQKHERFFHEKPFKRFSVFWKRRKFQYFKQTFLKTIVRFFHKILILRKTKHFSQNYLFFNTSSRFFLSLISFNYIRLFFFRRNYNLNILNYKSFDLLVHSHF